MHELVLSYKGHSLSLFFKSPTPYAVTEFEPGKTLYQILFERLVDGKTVSCRGIAREYRAKSEFLNGAQVLNMMRGIAQAACKSRDKALRKMRFANLPRGGASPVLLRTSPKSRFSQQQNRVIAETINALHADGKRHSYAAVRAVCLAALRQQGLAENVVLSPLKIWKVKRDLGFTMKIRSKRPKRGK